MPDGSVSLSPLQRRIEKFSNILFLCKRTQYFSSINDIMRAKCFFPLCCSKDYCFPTLLVIAVTGFKVISNAKLIIFHENFSLFQENGSLTVEMK